VEINRPILLSYPLRTFSVASNLVAGFYFFALLALIVAFRLCYFMASELLSAYWFKLSSISCFESDD